MIYLLIAMIWEISLILAFVGGILCKRRMKRNPKETALTEEMQRHYNRVQKEAENFATYDGTPQDVISDYE